MKEKYIKKIGFIIGIVAIGLLISGLVGVIRNSFLSKKSVSVFNEIINADITHLKQEGDAIANLENLKTALKTKDYYKILAIIAEEREERGIGLMGVADENGEIIARTKTPSQRGENAFLVSPQGRRVAQEGSSVSIETSSFDPVQVLMTTGRFIMDDNQKIGAVFTNNLLNDVYAEKLKAKLPLHHNAEVVFYTKGMGIYGSSFDDQEIRNLMRFYFHPESDWFKNGRTDEIIHFSGTSYYRVINIPLEGNEGSTTGALIFIPAYPFLKWVMFSCLISFVILFVNIFWIFKNKKFITKKKQVIFFTIGIFLIFAGCGYFIFQFFDDYSTIKTPIFDLYNSTIRFNPDSGVQNAMFESRVRMIIDTGGEDINAVGVVVHYDPTAVSVDEIDTTSSFCDHIIEKTIDDSAGIVRLYCVQLSSKAEEQSAVVGELVLRPNPDARSFSLRYDSESQVLANDGLGTNVLRSSTDAGFVIEGVDRDFIYSPTHPNQQKWYSSKNVELYWRGGEDAKDYLYVLDTNPNTVLINGTSSRTASTDMKMVIENDGIYYFHIASINERGKVAPIGDYRINIDTGAPEYAEIKTSQDVVSRDQIVRFNFTGRDSLSGMVNNFYIRVGNAKFKLPVGPQLFIPFSDVGDHEITVRFYDRAGNFSEQVKTITVER